MTSSRTKPDFLWLSTQSTNGALLDVFLIGIFRDLVGGNPGLSVNGLPNCCEMPRFERGLLIWMSRLSTISETLLRWTWLGLRSARPWFFPCLQPVYYARNGFPGVYLLSPSSSSFSFPSFKLRQPGYLRVPVRFLSRLRASGGLRVLECERRPELNLGPGAVVRICV